MQNSPITLPNAYIPEKESHAPLNILMVEDLASDALLTRIALDKTNIPYNLYTLNRGAQVMPYLAKYHFAGYQRDTPNTMPDVILLDLGLPGVNGFDILESLAQTHGMVRSVPIIIMSGFTHFDYLCKTNNLCIPAYLPKPCDHGKLRDILFAIRRGLFLADQ
jgi:DNA-binding response OmpR family regulator